MYPAVIQYCWLSAKCSAYAEYIKQSTADNSPRTLHWLKSKESLSYSTDPDPLKSNPAGFRMQMILLQDITHSSASPLARDSSSRLDLRWPLNWISWLMIFRTIRATKWHGINRWSPFEFGKEKISGESWIEITSSLQWWKEFLKVGDQLDRLAFGIQNFFPIEIWHAWQLSIFLIEKQGRCLQSNGSHTFQTDWFCTWQNEHVKKKWTNLFGILLQHLNLQDQY